MSNSIIPAEDTGDKIYAEMDLGAGKKHNYVFLLLGGDLQKTDTTSRKKCLSWVTVWKDTDSSVGEVQQVNLSRCERNTKDLIMTSTRSSGRESWTLVISLTLLSLIELRRLFYGLEPSTFRQCLLSSFKSLWKSLTHVHREESPGWFQKVPS